MAPKWTEYTPARASESTSDSDLDLEKESIQRPFTTRAKSGWLQYLPDRSSVGGFLIVTVALIATFFIGAWAFNTKTSSNVDKYFHPQPPPSGFKYHCGNSIPEAKELGCRFDLLNGGWVPPQCIDDDLADEFRKADDWHYYLDQAGKHEIPESALQHIEPSGNGDDFWTNLAWHKVHCNFGWRRMHRAVAAGAALDSAVANYAHTIHCGNVALETRPLEEISTRIGIVFVSC